MAKKHIFDDMLGQEIINRGHEKAWENNTRPLDEINKVWTKVYGKDNAYKRTPKYDPLRGSGSGEGFGAFLNTLFG